jgi:hypothetical protein
MFLLPLRPMTGFENSEGTGETTRRLVRDRHNRRQMEFPLDKATATADLLSDLFPPSLRAVGRNAGPGTRFLQMSGAELEAFAESFDLHSEGFPTNAGR